LPERLQLLQEALQLAGGLGRDGRVGGVDGLRQAGYLCLEILGGLSVQHGDSSTRFHGARSRLAHRETAESGYIRRGNNEGQPYGQASHEHELVTAGSAPADPLAEVREPLEQQEEVSAHDHQGQDRSTSQTI